MDGTRQFADFEAELATTRRVLERYPAGKSDWRPHEKSFSLGGLATHIAQLPMTGVMVLTAEGFDVAARKPAPPLATADELVKLLDSNVAKLNDAIASAAPDSLSRPWTLREGERVIFQLPRSAALRVLVMSHIIHHRGQLTVYYRLLGVPVPVVYGRSADE
jgi:uncharacterized damage-inducible protein DinB